MHKIYLDEEKIDTIENGKTNAYRIPIVKRGKHRIIFYKANDHKLKNFTEFILDNASNITIEISSSRDKITIENVDQVLRYRTDYKSCNIALRKYDKISAYLITNYYIYYDSWKAGPKHDRHNTYAYRYLLLGKANRRYAFLNGANSKVESKIIVYRTGTYENRGGNIGHPPVYAWYTTYGLILFDSKESLDRESDVLNKFEFSTVLGIEGYRQYISDLYPEIYSDYCTACQRLGIV